MLRKSKGIQILFSRVILEVSPLCTINRLVKCLRENGSWDLLFGHGNQILVVHLW